MTRIIRADLEGVVHAYREDGSVGAVLSAGDVVPDGVRVGDHLIDTEAEDTAQQAPSPVSATTQPTEPADDPEDEGDDEAEDDSPAENDDADDEAEGLEAPRGNASTEAWAEYADALGVEYETGATRAQIQAAIDASKD